MVEEIQRQQQFGPPGRSGGNQVNSDPLDGHYMMNGRTNQFVQERNGETVNDSA